MISEGDKVSIIGPSGCGKSTLLRYILGLELPDSGEILIDNQNITKLNKKELLDLRLNMGMLFQSAALFDSLTVAENIAFPLVENFGYSHSSASKKVARVLDMVKLNGYESSMPFQLSGGQKKRVGLARAIITEPKYILYDEPTTGLDPVMSNNIEDLIIQLNNVMNITSIVVSHQKSTILRTTDNIYMMHNHQLLSPETSQTILNSSNQIIKDFMEGNN